MAIKTPLTDKLVAVWFIGTAILAALMALGCVALLGWFAGKALRWMLGDL